MTGGSQGCRCGDQENEQNATAIHGGILCRPPKPTTATHYSRSQLRCYVDQRASSPCTIESARRRVGKGAGRVLEDFNQHISSAVPSSCIVSNLSPRTQGRRSVGGEDAAAVRRGAG